ncbi:MAG: coiled coil domain-containing protein [Betaproteobacteria bacterium]
MSKKDEYFALMEAQLKTWDAEVDKLKVKGEQLSAEASAKHAEQLRAMRANRNAAYKKLQEILVANESAWQHMQSGIDTA